MSIRDRLDAAIGRLLRKRGADDRTIYARVSPTGDRRSVGVECSDRGVIDALRREFSSDLDGTTISYRLLGAEDPERTRPLVVSGGVADVRREPSHASELRTQAICGDEVTALRDDGDWILARLDDGYIGWISAWSLESVRRDDLAAWTRRARHRVGPTHAVVRDEPSATGAPIARLVAGTPVAIGAGGRRGWRSAELVDGRCGYARSADVRPIRARGDARGRLVATGLSFRGIPYLWGGTTPNGFDCSGLIQRIFRIEGIALPRDADMQARVGVPSGDAAGEGLAPGDLLFFGRDNAHITHVGMALGDGLFVHSQGWVRVNSLRPTHAAYSPSLGRIWRFGRNPLGGPG